MSSDIADVIGRAVAKAPSWIKHELSSAEPALRERAEEALAAIIAAALAAEGSAPATSSEAL